MSTLLSLPLLDAHFKSWYYDAGVAKTRNEGSLGGTLQLGDGTTVGTFPAQLAQHGMSYDPVAVDYLQRAETAGELTFTDPTQFSVEVLFRLASYGVVGTYHVLLCKSGGGAGVSISYRLMFLHSAGPIITAYWNSLNAAGVNRGISGVVATDYVPAGVLIHVIGTFDGTTWRLSFNGVERLTQVTSGCYAPDAANFPLYIGAHRAGAGAVGLSLGGSIYNAAIYPWALTPSQVAQCYDRRRRMLQVY